MMEAFGIPTMAATPGGRAITFPISQFYHVSADNADPYHVFGGLQDNSVWIGDSQYPGGITNGRWESLFGGDGFWVFPDPADSTTFTPNHRAALLGESIGSRWRAG